MTESLWDDVAAVCEELGDEFDVWQDGLGQVALGLREDGTFAATVGGVVLTIPRQVAKTFLVGRIVFALCILFPNLNAIWTAHRVSTANSAFRSVVGLASRPGAARYVEKILTGDELTIVFRNGSVLRYGARAQNFGRGETQVDVEVFDEAQILRADTLEDMVPAANQAKIPHGALLFFMGTPPRPKDDGDEFLQRRAEALTGKPEGVVLERGDMVFIEFSADPNCGRPGGPDLMDKAQIEKANPSYPKRTPWVSILRMRKNLKDDDSWRREALGIWDSATANLAFPLDRWKGQRTDNPPTEGTVAFGVKFSIDGKRVALSAALLPDGGGPVYVECLGVADIAEGTTWLVEKFVEQGRSGPTIVVDGKSGAGDFVNSLRAARISQRRILVPTVDDVITAHSGMLSALHMGEVEHSGQPGLDAQVRGAGKRKIGNYGGWGLEPITEGGDVVAIESAILARHGLTSMKRRSNRNRSRGEAVFA